MIRAPAFRFALAPWSSGCLDVAAGEDCLTLTEVSAANPGTFEFDTHTCEVKPSTRCPDPYAWCPDWVELCNFSDRIVTDTSAYRVTNHRGTDDPNPWHPTPASLPAREVDAGACVVLPVQPANDGQPTTPCMRRLSDVGFEMETGGFAYVDAWIDNRARCRTSASFPGWIAAYPGEAPPTIHLDPEDLEDEVVEGILGTPTPGEPW